SAEILFCRSQPTPLGRRAVVLLRTLLERPGIPTSKDTLIEAAWPEVIVEESNLPVQIAAVRKALGEVSGGELWIETLQRRGYRYVGPTPTLSENEVSGLASNDHRDVVNPPQIGPERRQLSVMSCELICASLELEDMREAVRAYQGCVAETVGRFHGFVAN